MRIIAHRGLWTSSEEKNTPTAFRRATLHGFGIETDVRDFGNDIVIAHDPFFAGSQSFVDFFQEVKDLNQTFAINVKADGLSERIAEILKGGSKAEFLFFDMSGPEHIKYLQNKLPTLNRISEFEAMFTFPELSDDVWLDSFQSSDWQIDWIRQANIASRKIFIVSPELHGRNHLEMWSALASIPDLESIFLCTDMPEEAAKFFKVVK